MIGFLNAYLLETLLNSARNKRRILGLIRSAGGKIHIVMCRNIEEGLK